MTERSWSPYAAPAAPAGSRFFQPVSPAGWPSGPDHVFASVLTNLLADRVAESSRFKPSQVSVTLKMVARVGDSYELADRGEVSRVPSLESRRPGQRWRKMEGGELLDSFFVGGDAFAKAPDLEVWEAAREVAEAHSLRAGALRGLNDAAACLLCLRAGFIVDRGKLPHPSGMLR